MNYNYQGYYFNLFSIPLNYVNECFQCSATSMASLYVSSPREVTTSLTGHWTTTAHQARTLGQVKISPQQVSGLCWSFVNCSELSCILRCGVIALRFASFRRPLTCFPNIFDIFQRASFLWTRTPFEAFYFCGNFVPRVFLRYDEGGKIRDSR